MDIIVARRALDWLVRKNYKKLLVLELSVLELYEYIIFLIFGTTASSCFSEKKRLGILILSVLGILLVLLELRTSHRYVYLRICEYERI